MESKPAKPAVHEIYVAGPVTERFTELFPNLIVDETVDGTKLCGPVDDGAQLVAIVDLLVTTNSIPVLIQRMG